MTGAGGSPSLLEHSHCGCRAAQGLCARRPVKRNCCDLLMLVGEDMRHPIPTPHDCSLGYALLARLCAGRRPPAAASGMNTDAAWRLSVNGSTAPTRCWGTFNNGVVCRCCLRFPPPLANISACLIVCVFLADGGPGRGVAPVPERHRDERHADVPAPRPPDRRGVRPDVEQCMLQKQNRNRPSLPPRFPSAPLRSLLFNPRAKSRVCGYRASSSFTFSPMRLLLFSTSWRTGHQELDRAERRLGLVQ